jgi:hypothetical protein
MSIAAKCSCGKSPSFCIGGDGCKWSKPNPLLLNNKPVHVRPSLFAMYFEGLKQIAIEHGYNLCIHGSMNRDLDLVAFPWADEIKPHFEMAVAMLSYIGGQFNNANNEGDLCGVRKHGRVTYVINVLRRTPFTNEEDKQYYFDLNVYPPKEEINGTIPKH